MGLQQLGFNFFDDSPAEDVKPPAQAVAPESLIKSKTAAIAPKPTGESQENDNLTPPVVMEVLPVDIAFVIEEELPPLTKIGRAHV
jgi:hypothetical protein